MAAQVGQREGVAGVGGKGEDRRRVAGLQAGVGHADHGTTRPGTGWVREPAGPPFPHPPPGVSRRPPHTAGQLRARPAGAVPPPKRA